MRRTTWERSLKIWELQISCFEEFLGGENVVGLVPAGLPNTLGYACTFCAPTSPPPTLSFHSLLFSVLPRKNLKFTKDFLSLPNPQNPWKRQRKYQNNQGNSLLKINQGNPKNQGMEGQGKKSARFPCENANLPHCTYFTQRPGGGGVGICDSLMPRFARDRQTPLVFPVGAPFGNQSGHSL